MIIYQTLAIVIFKCIRIIMNDKCNWKIPTKPCTYYLKLLRKVQYWNILYTEKQIILKYNVLQTSYAYLTKQQQPKYRQNMFNTGYHTVPFSYPAYTGYIEVRYFMSTTITVIRQIVIK